MQRRILVVNDYSFEAARLDPSVPTGSPRHFLYGADRLKAAGYAIDVVSEEWSHWLAALDRQLRAASAFVGSIDRQAAAVRYLRSADAIYSPCQTQVLALTYLRATGLIRCPIVMLGHHPLVRGRHPGVRRALAKLMLRGIAALPTLGRAVADEANALAGRPVATPLQWGPDAHYYPKPIYPGTGVFATGRTGRDFTTFARAASIAGVPATILTFRSILSPDAVAVGDNVTLMLDDRFVPYSELTPMFASARALAIPMFDQPVLCGLTSLMDALGAGKAVIMTRNALVDLDIEREGIGIWVDPGDVDGWARAMRFVTDRPGEAEAMGRRARRLVDQGLTYEAFGDRIVQLVHQSITAGK